jgi:hypothetical protein
VCVIRKDGCSIAKTAQSRLWVEVPCEGFMYILLMNYVLDKLFLKHLRLVALFLHCNITAARPVAQGDSKS